jgi:hypothetical protein
MAVKDCLLFACLCLLAVAVQAQAPLGRDFQVNVRTEDVQLDPDVAYAEDATVAVAWASNLPPQPGDQYSRRSIVIRLFPANGPAGQERVVRQSDGGGQDFPSIVWQSGKRLLASWSEGAGVLGRILDGTARPLGPALLVDPAVYEVQGLSSVVAAPDGGFLVAWEAISGLGSVKVGIRARRLDGQGRPQGDLLELASSDTESRPSLAVSPQRDALVVWSFKGDDADGYAVTGQILNASLQPAGGPFLINTTQQYDQHRASATALPDGFIVVWESREQDGSLDGIYGQSLGFDGRKVGPEFQVNTVTDSAQRNPDVAADSHGNIIAVWQSFDGQTGDWSVRGRLFRPGGAPAGDDFEINTSPIRSGYVFPRVAFGPDGTFTVVWEVFADSDDIFARRFAASPGDEPCVLTSKRLLCDTGRTGGTAELPIPVKATAREVLLTGDVNGDGKQDLCLNRGAAYRCDTDRDGFPETSFRFGSGRSGELGLLGDMDGDGRAEPCIREGRELRCDTGHDGGRAEWVLASFGRPADPILLGDLNEDRRDDVCAFRSGRFLCDLNHDGIPEVDLAFGLPGDTPLLGDYDGDGRDDPCVFREGRFLCDTAHDGGEAEGSLSFGNPDSVPLLVNFDGI